MRILNYPAYAEHKQAHERLLAQLRAMYGKWEKGRGRSVLSCRHSSRTG